MPSPDMVRHRSGGAVSIRRVRRCGDILGLLTQFDAAFPRPISLRVGDLPRHAEKLAAHAHVCVAEVRGTVVGFIAFYANDGDHGVAFVTHIAVVAGSRGMGVGRRLMLHCVRVARDARLKQVRLEVDMLNVTAMKFYKSLGFACEGEPSLESCYMCLDLVHPGRSQ